VNVEGVFVGGRVHGVQTAEWSEGGAACWVGTSVQAEAAWGLLQTLL